MGENADGMGVVSPHGDGYERTASNVRLPPIERESNSNTFFIFPWSFSHTATRLLPLLLLRRRLVVFIGFL